MAYWNSVIYFLDRISSVFFSWAWFIKEFIFCLLRSNSEEFLLFIMSLSFFDAELFEVNPRIFWVPIILWMTWNAWDIFLYFKLHACFTKILDLVYDVS